MKLSLSGTVHFIGQEETKKSFTWRKLVLLRDGEYPEYFPIQFSGDDMAQLDEIGIGEEVQIEGYLKGREWTNQATGEVSYFLSISGKTITRRTTSRPQRASMPAQQTAAQAARPASQQRPVAAQQSAAAAQESPVAAQQESFDDDDLPF